MIFSNFTRSESGTTILFKNELPIEDVGSIKFFKDNASGSFTKKEFRWSFNKNYWASWETLNQGNLTRIDTSGKAYLFLEVRYVVSGSGAVTSFSVNYQQAPAAVGPGETCDIPVGTTVDPTPIPPEYNTRGGGQSSGVNATTLCGESCDYYLWRPNHKGEQPISSITDLQKVLSNLASGIQNSITGGQNISSEGIAVFYDKVGQDLLFRTIDVSGPGLEITEQDGVIYFTVDASFSYDDASINQLYDFYYALESDLNDLSVYVDTKFYSTDASIIRIDGSINDLYSKLGGDSSIYGIQNIGGEVSIYSDTQLGIARLRTLQGTGGINVYVNGDTIIIDGSISGGDSSISGVKNIGGGSGEVFSAIDSSGIIELRTIDGSGGTTVTTDGSTIIISSEDTSVKNIINVGTGTGEILSEIDTSGIAKLRKLKGSGDVSIGVQGDDVVIFINADVSISADPWIDADPVSADVGGIQGGDYVPLGSSPRDVLEDILYEYFPPDVSLQIYPNPGPTSSIGYYQKWLDITSGGAFSSGAYYSYSFNNDDFTKVKIHDVSIFDGGGFSDSLDWIGANSGYRPPVLSGSPPISNNEELILNMIMDVKIDGDSSVYDTSTNAKFVLPYFYGVIPDEKSPGVPYDYTNVDGAVILSYCSSTKLIVPKQSNEIVFDVSVNYQKIKFVYAYDASYGQLSSIFDVKNDFNVTTSFDISTNVWIDNGGVTPINERWIVYVKSHWISFPPDVSTFKIIFNI